jgi:hypothetical protein
LGSLFHIRNNAKLGRMRICITRLTNERHALELLRDGGVAERVELETRSFLLHDLIHYAVESTAGLTTGVWGTLAAGCTLAELNARTADDNDDDDNDQRERFGSRTADLLTIERVTGPLHAVAQGRASPEEGLAAIESLMAAEGTAPPAWLTLELVVAAMERLRQLLGRFRATPFGKPMELPWP